MTRYFISYVIQGGGRAPIEFGRVIKDLDSRPLSEQDLAKIENDILLAMDDDEQGYVTILNYSEVKP